MRLGFSLGLGSFPTSSATAPWTPARISGNVLALDARRASDFTDDGVNGITEWRDFSGGNRHFSRSSTLSWCPQRQPTGGPGSQAAVYFTAGDSLFGPSFSGLTAGNIFILAKKDAEPGTGDGGLSRFGSHLTNAVEATPYNTGLHYAGFGSTARKDNIPDPGNHAAWFLLEWISASGEWTARFNRAQFHTTATNTVGWHTRSELGKDTDGSAASAISTRWEGHIAAVYMFDHKLSGGDRTLVEDYVLSEWGV